MRFDRSRALYEEARTLLPGGVDSPVRAFGAVGGTPLFIARGEGAWLVDEDDNRFVDYVLSWGPLLLGHAPAAVVAAISDTAARGTSFGAPSALESALARLVKHRFPSMELLRFVNSGTEATMSAIRVARAHTGRSRIVKFEGCYHGHADLLLVRAGSGVATLGLPDSAGVTAGAVADTMVLPFNDLAAVEHLFAAHGGEIAAVIVEPVAGNMGVVPPAPGFLQGLARVTAQHSALLIFDEVMTGFRVHPGGAQALYGIEPDLTTLGKVLGGGLPVGAYGGRREIMERVAPSGPVYQAGTLAGNPLTMSAGIATLRLLDTTPAWARADEAAAQLAAGIVAAAAETGIPVRVQRVGTMLTAFFTDAPVTDWRSADRCDRARFGRVFHSLLQAGVHWVPSQFESAFLSAVHGARELAITQEAFRAALRKESSHRAAS